MWWTTLVAVACAFGWSDADERVRDHLIATERLDPSTEVRVWFQLELPLPGLDVVLAKVSHGGVLGPGKMCFAVDAAHAGPLGGGRTGWVSCEPEAPFAAVVKAYDLAAHPDGLGDFDWLRLWVMAHPGVCGDDTDLLVANPRIPRKLLNELPAPEVERPETGGVELRLGCVVGTQVQRVTTTVSAAGVVATERETLGTVRVASPDPIRVDGL